MGAADVIIALVFLSLFLLPALKKILEAAQQGEGADRGQAQREFEASPENVREFLESIAGRRQADRQGQGRAPGRREPPSPPPRLRRQPERPSARQRSGRSPSMRRAERRIARTRREAAAKAQAAQKAEETPSAPAPGRRPEKRVEAPRAGKFNLKRAVVWSEILRPPVSMRPFRHHVPPSAHRR